MIAYLFNNKYCAEGLPCLKNFMKAFYKFRNEVTQDFLPIPIGRTIRIRSANSDHIIETVKGQIELLDYFISNKRYEEIVTMTHNNIWELIFADSGMSKEEFIPQLLSNWKCIGKRILIIVIRVQLIIKNQSHGGASNYLYLNTIHKKSIRVCIFIRCLLAISFSCDNNDRSFGCRSLF